MLCYWLDIFQSWMHACMNHHCARFRVVFLRYNWKHKLTKLLFHAKRYDKVIRSTVLFDRWQNVFAWINSDRFVVSTSQNRRAYQFAQIAFAHDTFRLGSTLVCNCKLLSPQTTDSALFCINAFEKPLRLRHVFEYRMKNRFTVCNTYNCQNNYCRRFRTHHAFLNSQFSARSQSNYSRISWGMTPASHSSSKWMWNATCDIRHWHLSIYFSVVDVSEIQIFYRTKLNLMWIDIKRQWMKFVIE